MTKAITGFLVATILALSVMPANADDMHRRHHRHCHHHHCHMMIHR